MRLGRCSTSGQVVSTASSTPASATSASSRAPNDGEGAQRGRRRAPAGAPAPAVGARPVAAGAAPSAGAGRSAGLLAGLGRPVLTMGGVRGHADRRSIREPPEPLRRTARGGLSTSRASGFASRLRRDEGSRGRSRRRRRGVRRDRAAPRGVRARRARRRRARARAGRGRAARRAGPLRAPSGSTPPSRARARRADRRASRPDAVLNACDPRFNEPIFDACFEARVTYLDMAMTLSHPHPERPHELPGEMLGDLPARAATRSGSRPGVLALVGIGVEPGLSDVFARYAADELFSRSTRSACATAPTWSSRATTSRPRSRSGRRSRSA